MKNGVRVAGAPSDAVSVERRKFKKVTVVRKVSGRAEEVAETASAMATALGAGTRVLLSKTVEKKGQSAGRGSSSRIIEVQGNQAERVIGFLMDNGCFDARYTQRRDEHTLPEGDEEENEEGQMQEREREWWEEGGGEEEQSFDARGRRIKQKWSDERRAAAANASESSSDDGEEEGESGGLKKRKREFGRRGDKSGFESLMKSWHYWDRDYARLDELFERQNRSSSGWACDELDALDSGGSGDGGSENGQLKESMDETFLLQATSITGESRKERRLQHRTQTSLSPRAQEPPAIDNVARYYPTFDSSRTLTSTASEANRKHATSGSGGTGGAARPRRHGGGGRGGRPQQQRGRRRRPRFNHLDELSDDSGDDDGDFLFDDEDDNSIDHAAPHSYIDDGGWLGAQIEAAMLRAKSNATCSSITENSVLEDVKGDSKRQRRLPHLECDVSALSEEEALQLALALSREDQADIDGSCDDGFLFQRTDVGPGECYSNVPDGSGDADDHDDDLKLALKLSLSEQGIDPPVGHGVGDQLVNSAVATADCFTDWLRGRVAEIGGVEDDAVVEYIASMDDVDDIVEFVLSFFGEEQVAFAQEILLQRQRWDQS